MVYFRKRLTPEILGEINEMIVQDAKARQAEAAESKDDDDGDKGSGAGGNRGTMIVDAACAPSHIRYPQDVSLLNEARENAEKLLDSLHDPADGKKPRTYRKRARKDYLKYARCRKHTAKMTRKAIGKQLCYLKRDLGAIESKLVLGKTLTRRQTERLLPSTPSTSSRSTCTITGRTAFRIALSASASRISARSFVGRRETDGIRS